MRIETRETADIQRWKLRDAARQLEAQFLHQLLRAMRRTVPNTQSTYTTRMYTDMMDEALAKQLAQSEQFGLGKLLYEKLSPYLNASASGGVQDEENRS
jgi:Rod binding domain-containing protein